jgi:hypothetical protein
MEAISIFDDNACEPPVEYRGKIDDEIRYYLDLAGYCLNSPLLEPVGYRIPQIFRFDIAGQAPFGGSLGRSDGRGRRDAGGGLSTHGQLLRGGMSWCGNRACRVSAPPSAARCGFPGSGCG